MNINDPNLANAFDGCLSNMVSSTTAATHSLSHIMGLLKNCDETQPGALGCKPEDIELLQTLTQPRLQMLAKILETNQQQLADLTQHLNALNTPTI